MNSIENGKRWVSRGVKQVDPASLPITQRVWGGYLTSFKELTEFPDHPAFAPLNQGKALITITLPGELAKSPAGWSDETTMQGYRIITKGTGGFIIFNPNGTVDTVRNIAGEIAAIIARNTNHRPIEKSKKGELPKLTELFCFVWRTQRSRRLESNEIIDASTFRGAIAKEIALDKSLSPSEQRKAKIKHAQANRMARILDDANASGDQKMLNEIAAYIKFCEEFYNDMENNSKNQDAMCKAIAEAAKKAAGVPERLAVLTEYNLTAGPNQKQNPNSIREFLKKMGFGGLPAPTGSFHKKKREIHTHGVNERGLKKDF